MHIHQQNHWNRVLFHWYQSYHWYQWRPFLSPLTPMESICEYWTTLQVFVIWASNLRFGSNKEFRSTSRSNAGVTNRQFCNTNLYKLVSTSNDHEFCLIIIKFKFKFVHPHPCSNPSDTKLYWLNGFRFIHFIIRLERYIELRIVSVCMRYR